MPAKTENYKLNQWKKEDDFLMADFNADNTALETALTGLQSAVDSKAAQSEVDGLKTTVNGLSSSKANQSDLNNLANAVNGKVDAGTVNHLTNVVNGKIGIVTGTYTGNGAAYQDIHLGFQPKALFLTTKHGVMTFNGLIQGGLAFPGVPVLDYNNEVALEITGSGFRVWYANKNYLNENANTFHYIAFA